MFFSLIICITNNHYLSEFFIKGIENLFIMFQSRSFFLKINLYISLLFYQYLLSHNLPEYVSYRKSSDHLYIFWISEWKIIRIINTILTQIYAIESNNQTYALDRFGSHPTENFIGLIRLLCNNDNRFSTVLHNLSRYEIINRESPIIYTKPQNKRLNAGGVVLKEGNISFETGQTCKHR